MLIYVSCAKIMQTERRTKEICLFFIPKRRLSCLTHKTWNVFFHVGLNLWFLFASYLGNNEILR